jgi:hypothetical protein
MSLVCGWGFLRFHLTISIQIVNHFKWLRKRLYEMESRNGLFFLYRMISFIIARRLAKINYTKSTKARHTSNLLQKTSINHFRRSTIALRVLINGYIMNLYYPESHKWEIVGQLTNWKVSKRVAI